MRCTYLIFLLDFQIHTGKIELNQSIPPRLLNHTLTLVVILENPSAVLQMKWLKNRE